MRGLLVATVLLLAGVGPGAAQSDAPIGLRVSTSALYESNLDHATIPRAAFGGVVALGMRLQDRDRRPRVTLDAESALHRYSAPTRFERASLAAEGGLALALARGVTWETALSLSLRGSSEDRDLNDQYQAKERLELRLARGTAARVAASVRLKRYPEAAGAGRNALNRYAEVEILQRLHDGGRLTLSARLETNAAAASRYDYRRVTWGLALESAPGRWQQLKLDVTYRVQHYTDRQVEDGEALRRDYRVSPELRWTLRPWHSTAVTFAYDFENRSSNDPDEAYDAHRLSLGMTRWW